MVNQSKHYMTDHFNEVISVTVVVSSQKLQPTLILEKGSIKVCVVSAYRPHDIIKLSKTVSIGDPAMNMK